MFNVINIFKYLFIISGLITIVIAFFIYKNNVYLSENAIESQGKVIELFLSHSSNDHSDSYQPVVEFTTSQGKVIKFTSPYSSNPAEFFVGEEVSILYVPDMPQDARIKGLFSLWRDAIIIGGFGSLFFLVGFTILLVTKLKNRKEKYLKQYGTPIQTKFQSVQINKSFKVNGRSPFQVFTQWQDPLTSEIHVFQSNNIWFDPTNYINNKAIIVYIDGNNPKKYFMDLSFLPKKAR